MEEGHMAASEYMSQFAIIDKVWREEVSKRAHCDIIQGKAGAETELSP